MASILQLLVNFISTLVLLSKSGRARSLILENLTLRQQLIVAKRLKKIAIILKPATLLRFHKFLVNRKYKKHYLSTHPTSGPSWLTFLAHQKDSLWSIDFFRCESINLRSYWVMVVMDIFTRRIIGFAVCPDFLTGVGICRMFNKIIVGKSLPKYFSSDNDPLFKYHRWIANLYILEIESVKSVPYTPISHPFFAKVQSDYRCPIAHYINSLC